MCMCQHVKRIRHNSPSWLNGEIISCMKLRDNMHKLALRFTASHYWLHYCKLRNQVVKLIKNYTSNYYNQVINSSLTVHPSKAWNNIKSVLHFSEKFELNLIAHNGLIHLDSKTIANIFNDYFVSICKPDYSHPPPYIKAKEDVVNLNSFQITDHELQCEIEKLPTSRAVGIDHQFEMIKTS